MKTFSLILDNYQADTICDVFMTHAITTAGEYFRIVFERKKEGENFENWASFSSYTHSNARFLWELLKRILSKAVLKVFN